MRVYLWIALGGALGSVARYWCSGLVARHVGETFPWGTLVVNVAGSFLIGLLATLTGPDGRLLMSPTARQFFLVGVFGGFTTQGSRMRNLRLVEMRGSETVHRRRRSEGHPFPNRGASLPSRLSYRSDLMRAPWGRDRRSPCRRRWRPARRAA